MAMPVVSSLYVVYIKSTRAVAVPDWSIGRMGMAFDHQWMVVDERGMVVAQRPANKLGAEIKSMSLITVLLNDGYLVCTAPDMPPLKLPIEGFDGKIIPVQIWDRDSIGVPQSQEATEWFTEFLSRERPGSYRLVRMPDDPRKGFRKAKRGDAHVGYHDADSFLIIGQSSLDDLNGKIANEALPMNRFRPTIVVSGCEPYAEDTWGEIRIGYVYFTGTKECVRCPITTQNQDTTERGKEPLATLATYRRVQGEGVVFGMNFVHRGNGIIRVGDEIEILERRKSLI